MQDRNSIADDAPDRAIERTHTRGTHLNPRRQ